MRRTDFKRNSSTSVMFYGDVQLGSVQKEVEITKGFVKHSGINDATLRNVTVGNDCLIEKVGIIFITIPSVTTASSLTSLSWRLRRVLTYGEGNLISVLNEVGDGNVIFFHDLIASLQPYGEAFQRQRPQECYPKTGERGDCSHQIQNVERLATTSRLSTQGRLPTRLFRTIVRFLVQVV